MSITATPNHRQVIAAISSISNESEYLKSTNGALNIAGSFSLSGSPIPIAGATTAIGVAIVDGSGNQITSFGGGTQYANNTSVATPTGTASLGFDGSNVRALSTDSSGRLQVNVITAPTTTVTQGTATNLKTQSETYQGGTAVGSGNPLQVTLANTGANATAIKIDGSAVTQPVSYATTGSGTAIGALRVELANNGTGVIATVGAVTAITNALPSGTNTIGKISDITTSVVPGTGATNLGKAEDAGHSSGDTGVFSLGVRNDTLAVVTNTNSDYSQLSTDDRGHALTAYAPRALKTPQATTITNSTAETTVLTAVASTFLDVYGVVVTNTSATATSVAFKDSTAGTTRFTVAVPANDTRGFMLPMDAAYPQTAINNNWTATVTNSVTSILITMFSVKTI